MKLVKQTKRKTFVFIDATNIIYGCRTSGWKMDFAKLISYLKYRYDAKKIFYYAGFDKDNQKQLSFYQKLEKFGYTLVLKPFKIFGGTTKNPRRKANCDVDLTFDAMYYLNKYDDVIFMTGDGDFLKLINYCLIHKNSVKVIASISRTAKELKLLSRRGNNVFVNIDILKDVLAYK